MVENYCPSNKNNNTLKMKEYTLDSNKSNFDRSIETKLINIIIYIKL